MKKLAWALLLAVCLMIGANSVFGYEVPDAYMGFSVSDEWYVLSKDMEDDALLDALGLTAGEVNEALVRSDCEYFIINPAAGREVYVKVKQNDLSWEFYNILETDDQQIKDSLDRILEEGFSVDGFSYNDGDVTLTAYPQMKFITVPGTVQYDGKNHGMVFGATFVNGKGIAFIMYLDKETAEEADLNAFNEIVGSVSFTVIKEKGASQPQETENEKPESGLSFIAGGLGGLALVALCLFLIDRIKKSERGEENGENRENGKNQKID